MCVGSASQGTPSRGQPYSPEGHPRTSESVRSFTLRVEDSFPEPRATAIARSSSPADGARGNPYIHRIMAIPETKFPGRRESGRARRPRLSDRRLGLHLPRLSRAAAAHPPLGRAAGGRRARLLRHAVEAVARDRRARPADAYRGDLRLFRARPSATICSTTTRRTGRSRRAI